MVPLGREPQLSLSPHAPQQHIGVLGTYGGVVVVVVVIGGGGGTGVGEGLGEGLGEGGLGEGVSPAMRSIIAL